MPNVQIALLRGINVGKAKRVAMAELRTLFESLGYGDVATLLNSGNVVFTTPRAATGDKLAKRIETAIAEELGVSCRVMVVSAAELASIVKGNPLLDRADNHSRLMVGVADAAALAKLEPHLKTDWSPEAIAVGPRVVYYWCPNSILESPVGAAVARTLGDRVTSRNWATMLKLHTLANAIS